MVGAAGYEGGIEILPYGLQGVYVQPSRLHPGDSTEGIVILSGPAPDRGAQVLVTTTNPNIWPTEFGVTIPPGATGGTFQVKMRNDWTSNAPFRIIADYAGLQKSVNLTQLAPPAAPTGLSATVVPAGVSPTQVRLVWTDNSNNEEAFAVWRKTPASDWRRIAVLPPDSTSYSDTAVGPATTYTYRVRATCDIYPSDWSNETSASLAGPPAALTGLSAQVLSPTEIGLSWTSGKGDETGVAILRKSGASDWQRIGVVPPWVTKYVDRTTKPGTTYTYRLRTHNDDFASAWTSEVTASAPAVP